MRFFLLAVSVSLLSGCLTAQQAALQKCPPVAVNISSPDFYAQPPDPALRDAFYPCAIDAYKDGRFLAVTNGRDPNAENGQQQGLNYQWTLWRQLAAGEKTPGQAQEAWMLWSANGRAIDAQKAAAYAALQAQAAQQQNAAIMRPVTCMRNGPFTNCN